MSIKSPEHFLDNDKEVIAKLEEFADLLSGKMVDSSDNGCSRECFHFKEYSERIYIITWQLLKERAGRITRPSGCF